MTRTGSVDELASRLSYELEGITARGEFLRAAGESVTNLLPSDQLGWLAVDLTEGEAEVYGTGGAEQPSIVAALARFADGHPLLGSFRQQPNDMTPRRLSDVISPGEWRSHQVYSEVYRPLSAVYQLAIIATPFCGGSWAGWGCNRIGRDFTDDEIDLAARLQPVLIALNHVSVRAFGNANPGRAQAEGADQVGLTPRELRILELLAVGLTATAIGHACRISPGTVRKHLQNIYAKLDCHDRLMAVQKGAELGLVGSPAPS